VVPSFLDVANARDMASLLRLAAARGLAGDRHLAPSLGHLPLVLLAHDVDTARNTLIADHSVAEKCSRTGYTGPDLTRPSKRGTTRMVVSAAVFGILYFIILSD
jgi:hypothetical protein